MNNAFLLAYKRKPGAVPFDPNSESGESFPGAVYLCKALVEADTLLGPRGITFLLTSDVRSIPIEGPNVVVFLREDEWCRVPPYAASVRAVFKAHGETLTWDRNPLREPGIDAALSSLQDVRTEIARVPTRFRRLRKQMAIRVLRRKPIFTIFDYPLGYFRQLDLPLKTMKERTYDVYFGGSLISQRAAKYPMLARLETPKIRSRRKMVEALRLAKAEHPSLAIEIELTPSFWKTGQSEAESYSRFMMDSRVCVVPRGTQLETFRYFEAMRAGCVVVCENLPRRRYYDGAPHLKLSSWNQLGSTLMRLKSEPDELERLHRASLKWYEARCSEEAVGQFIAESIQSLR